MIKTTGSARLEFTDDIPVEKVEEWLGTLPAGTKLNVSQNPGDRPFDRGTSSLHANWTN